MRLPTIRGAMRRLRRYAPRPAILMYHRVASASVDPWGIAVAPERFAEQVQFLARRRTVLRLAAFVEALCDGTLPRDAIALTFDDGYVDNLHNAEPVLAAAGLPATMFVVSGMVGRPEPFWWDELTDIVLQRDAPLDCRIEIAGEHRHLQLPRKEGDDAERGWRGHEPPRTPRQAAYAELWQALRTMPASRREAVMARLRDAAGPMTTSDASRAVTADELKQAARRRTFDIGGHTISHPVLPLLTREEQLDEVGTARDALSGLIGSSIVGFAYPYGVTDEATCGAVRAAGFLWACSTEGSTVRHEHDRFALPRITAPDGGAAALVERLRASA